jgi:hypothetical protein
MLASGSWVLVVVRAWLDPSGPRIRLLRTSSDGQDVEAVVDSPESAGAVLAEWLDELRREPRRSGDAGRDGTSLGSPRDQGRHP